MDEFKKNLLEGIAQIETTKTHMASMANAFDGSRITSQAGAVMAQIQALGGVTNLTAAEQRKANVVLQEAIDKYRVLGKDAPPQMQALADATRGAGVQVEATGLKVGGLKGEMQKFDGILSSMGINLSAPIRAIGELGDMAGRSVKDVGLLGAAGAAFGAGIAGWKVGRLVADFFDLDTKIGNATAKLLGYGDMAAQVAGAKADALNGKLSYQANLLKQAAQAGEENNVVLSEAAQAWNDSAAAVSFFSDEGQIAGTVLDGIVTATGEAIHASEAYRSELKFTTGVIADQVDSLDLLASAKKADAAASKEAAKAAAEAAKVFQQSFTSTVQPVNQDQIAALGGDAKARTRLEDLEARSTRTPRGLFEGVTTQAQWKQAQEMQYLLAQLRQYFQGVPGFAGGVTNFSGGMAMVGERGPEMVRLPRGSDVIPNHQLGGGNLTVNLTVKGSVIGTDDAFQRSVSDAILNVFRSSGLSMPGVR